MKKCIAVLTAVVLMISSFGCRSGSHDVYEEIYKRYNNLESFSAVAEVMVKSDKGENVYKVNEFYKAPDYAYLEITEPDILKGSGFSAANGEYRLVSGFGHSEKVEKELLSQHGVLFINDFFEAYFKSEETAVKASSDSGSPVTVMECYLNGKNRNRFIQTVHIDNKTLLPIKMETLDVDKKPVVTVMFREFQRNCEIDEEIFK
ncbi:MAG: hypothetical protein E7412_03740 [Ruminococcaceae bacterium]|nr:hypothetical protein [Oscillospiraceae bacterium]